MSISLKIYNSFGIEALAGKFILVSTLDELQQWLEKYRGEAVYILGEGSNTLFVRDPDQWILNPDAWPSRLKFR